MHLKRFFFATLMLMVMTTSGYPALSQERAPNLGKKIGQAVVQVVAYDAAGKVLKTGSGCFITADGGLLTSWQVLLGASRAAVKDAAGQEYPLQTVVAGDAKTGLLLATAGPLPGPMAYLSLEKQLPRVMERVVAAGANSKAQLIVGEGVVSSLLEFPGYGKVIQVSMPVTAELRGGPVVNAAGRVLGIAASGLLEGQRLNFAIPAARLMSLKKEDQAFPDWAGAHVQEALAECFKKAAAAAKANNRQEATGYYQEAVRVKPDDARARNNLGSSYYHEGRYRESLEEFRQAVRLKPESPQYQLSLGLAAIKAGQLPEAEGALEALNRLDPKMGQKLQASLQAAKGSPKGAPQPLGPEPLTELFKRIRLAVLVVERYDARDKRLGAASGFFINAQGHFITNFHVIRGIHGAWVKTIDGKRYKVAKILAEDKGRDVVLAAIEPPAGGVAFLQMTGALPAVGEEVVAMGNPRGMEFTLSTGIISAIRTYDKPPRKELQHTAPTSPGNSGSPLLNRQGMVVGVHHAGLRPGAAGKAENLNFSMAAQHALALKPGPGKTLPQRYQEFLAEAQELVRQGAEYLQQKDLKKATTAFKEATLSCQNYALAHWYLAYTHYLNDNQEEFKKEYALVQKLDAELAKELAKLTFEAESGAKKTIKPKSK